MSLIDFQVMLLLSKELCFEKITALSSELKVMTIVWDSTIPTANKFCEIYLHPQNIKVYVYFKSLSHTDNNYLLERKNIVIFLMLKETMCSKSFFCY